jgi:hypothetical protein
LNTEALAYVAAQLLARGTYKVSTDSRETVAEIRDLAREMNATIETKIERGQTTMLLRLETWH